MCIFFVSHDEKNYKLKKLDLDPGSRLKHEYHHIGTVNLDGITTDYKFGQTILIPKENKERVKNKTNQNVAFIEMQNGSYFGKYNILIIQDDYKRI
jgi:mannose-6-phosphate isomerase